VREKRKVRRGRKEESKEGKKRKEARGREGERMGGRMNPPTSPHLGLL